MMRRIAWVLTLTGPLLMLAQTPPAKKAPAAAAPKAAPAKKAAPVAPPAPARPDGLYVTFDLTHGGKPVGKIVAKLFEKESPVTVKNFVDLARGTKAYNDPKLNRRVQKPLYNGLTFHRVIPDFMIQGGDPLGNGTGGTESIVDEFHPSLSFTKAGLLAMANAGPRTGSCQFFITEKATPWLDGKHTIFGEVIEGLDLAASLARVPRDSANKPTEPIVMQKVTIARYPAGQPVWPGEVAAKKTPAAKTAAPQPATSKPAAPKSPAKQ
jgi:peptidyl-prolyl cis-trans isomerase A (cyclophilin A)